MACSVQTNFPTKLIDMRKALPNAELESRLVLTARNTAYLAGSIDLQSDL